MRHLPYLAEMEFSPDKNRSHLHWGPHHATIECFPRFDDSFGPAVDGACRDGFDFTLFFEQTILSIAPSILLLFLVPPRLRALYCVSVKTFADTMHTAKAVRLTCPYTLCR